MSETPASKIDALASAVEDNTKATMAMSAALRTIYLVLLALAAIAAAAFLLREGKLSEANFMALTLVCLSPFFGEGIGRILDRIPLVGKKADAIKSSAVVACAIGGLLFASGCMVRMPLGKDGQYGAAIVGYELPNNWRSAPASGRNHDLKQAVK